MRDNPLGIDSSLSDNFGRSVIYGLSAATTVVTVSIVGGPPFVAATLVLGVLYYNGVSHPASWCNIILIALGVIVVAKVGRSSLKPEPAAHSS